MMNGMYAAISGLDANQTMLNVTANNLANVNTIGYKSARVTFADSLAQIVRGASGSTTTNGGTNPLQVGLGVQVASTDNEMSEGSFQSTNNPLDVAIQGEGFLRVGSGTPPAEPPYTAKLPANFQYTREGDLTTDTKGFLTTQAGTYVIGKRSRGDRETEAGTTYAPGAKDTYIVIPPGSANVVDRPGRVGQLHRREPQIPDLRTAGHRGLPVAGAVPQPGRPGAPRRLAVGADRQLGRPDRGHPQHRRPSARRSAGSSRCQTSTSPPR